MNLDFNHCAQIEKIYSQIMAKNIKTLGITSASEGEGKSTLALALAKRHAAQGKSTLLVDFNLASPSLSQHFNCVYQEQNGLAENFKDNIQYTTTPQLSFLAAPINSRHLLQLLDYEVLNGLVQDWAQQYDLVIIDCININHDHHDVIPAELICTLTNSCIMVVMSARTIETKILEASSKLMHAHLLGTVINDLHNPPIVQELIQSSHKLDRILPKSMHKLRRKLKTSAFLSIEV